MAESRRCVYIMDVDSRRHLSEKVVSVCLQDQGYVKSVTPSNAMSKEQLKQHIVVSTGGTQFEGGHEGHFW